MKQNRRSALGEGDAVMGDRTKNFSGKEFACRCGCGYERAEARLVAMVQKIRDAMDEPLRVTSGCRCATHNQKVGGVPESWHTQGLAADLQCASGSGGLFRTILKLCAQGELNDLEYCKHYPGKNFVHLDMGAKRKNRFAEQG